MAIEPKPHFGTVIRREQVCLSRVEVETIELSDNELFDIISLHFGLSPWSVTDIRAKATNGKWLALEITRQRKID
jgi:hypothetical protein